MSDSESVTQCIEALCQCGCDAVRATITALETGQRVKQVEGLDEGQRRQVLVELKAIMAVYDKK